MSKLSGYLQRLPAVGMGMETNLVLEGLGVESQFIKQSGIGDEIPAPWRHVKSPFM